MCAPLVMTGLQVAASVASQAANHAEARYQARLATAQARGEADAALARAAEARDRAARDTASRTAGRAAAGVRLQDESVVSTLARAHADSLAAALAEEGAARGALYQGNLRAGSIRRSARSALMRSLLSDGLSVVTPAARAAGLFVPG